MYTRTFYCIHCMYTLNTNVWLAWHKASIVDFKNLPK